MPIKYASLEEARNAVNDFGGQISSVTHVGDFSNSVFRCLDHNHQERILRFTDLTHRNRDAILGELDFLSHLHADGVRACYPIPFEDGSLLRSSRSCSDRAYSLLSVAPGICIEEPSPHWARDFFQEWGRNLASIHLSSQSFQPAKMNRWFWDREDLILQADELIPKDDTGSRREFFKVLDECARLAKNRSNFGLIHADHAP